MSLESKKDSEEAFDPVKILESYRDVEVDYDPEKRDVTGLHKTFEELMEKIEAHLSSFKEHEKEAAEKNDQAFFIAHEKLQQLKVKLEFTLAKIEGRIH